MLKAFAGGAVFGRVQGAAPARVLALHGWGRTHRDFEAVLDGLDAVSLDLPGFGASPSPPEAWGGREYANAVADVLPELDRPAVVVGHSFGGRVAVHLAAAHPGAVRALVLTGVPLVRPPGVAPRKPAVAFRAARFLHRRGLLPDDRMERLRRRYGSPDYRAATGVMRAIHVKAVNETYEEQLVAIRAPVALVWGEDDGDVRPTVAEAAAALLPSATVTLVPGAGHLLPVTHPHALRSAIDGFLR